MLPCIDDCCNPRRRADWPDWTVLGRRTVVARKEHTCKRCGEKIRPGEAYERTAGLVDGRFIEDKTHHGWCE